MMPFPTMAETQRSNGDRHKLKGLINSIMGRPDWAAFSYLKMIKNYKRANFLDELTEGLEEEKKWYLVRTKMPSGKQ